MEILVKADITSSDCIHSCVQGGVSKKDYCAIVTLNGITYKEVDGVQYPICYIQPCDFKPCYFYMC